MAITKFPPDPPQDESNPEAESSESDDQAPEPAKAESSKSEVGSPDVPAPAKAESSKSEAKSSESETKSSDSKAEEKKGMESKPKTAPTKAESSKFEVGSSDVPAPAKAESSKSEAKSKHKAEPLKPATSNQVSTMARSPNIKRARTRALCGGFDSPRGMCCDEDFIYIADTLNHKLKVHNRDSLDHVRTVGSSGGDGPTQFKQPTAVCCDERHAYVLDGGNCKLKVYDKASLAHVRTLGGKEGDGPRRFRKNAGGVCCDEKHLFVADTYNNKVKVYRKATLKHVHTLGSERKKKTKKRRNRKMAELKKGLPKGWSCAWSKSRNLPYYKNKATNESQWHRPGECAKTAKAIAASKERPDSHPFWCPTGVCCDEKHLFVADSGSAKVMVYSKATLQHVRTLGGDRGDGPMQFFHPYGVCCDEKHLFVADPGNNEVKVYVKATLQHVHTLGGEQGDKILLGTVKEEGDGLDASEELRGNREVMLAAIEQSGHALQVYEPSMKKWAVKLDPCNRATLRWLVRRGGRGGKRDRWLVHFERPHGVCCAADRLYVLDSHNHKLKELSLGGAPDRAAALVALRAAMAEQRSPHLLRLQLEKYKRVVRQQSAFLRARAGVVKRERAAADAKHCEDRKQLKRIHLRILLRNVSIARNDAEAKTIESKISGYSRPRAALLRARAEAVKRERAAAVASNAEDEKQCKQIRRRMALREASIARSDAKAETIKSKIKARLPASVVRFESLLASRIKEHATLHGCDARACRHRTRKRAATWCHAVAGRWQAPRARRTSLNRHARACMPVC